jgi:HEAT repeat protein
MTNSQTLNKAPLLICLLFSASICLAQDEELKSTEPKERRKAAEQIGKTGNQDSIPHLAQLLNDPVADVRSEAVASIISIGTQHSLAPLAQASRDAMPNIQMLAVDGMVNFYVPGYVERGWMASLKGVSANVKDRFRKPSPIVIEPHLQPSAEVVEAVGRVIEGGTSMDSRAEAARAAGILRARAAMPQLQEALKSKNSPLILESVRAIEKIGDRSAGPSLLFLLRDLDRDVQLAVIEAVGQLRVQEAAPDLLTMVKTSPHKAVRRQAMIAAAKVPAPDHRDTFGIYLHERDAQLRAAAAEGIGRLGDANDQKVIRDAFAAEKNESARLSMAFAAVHLGDTSMLSYLLDGLNSTFHRGEARPFLMELARKPEILSQLYSPLTSGTKDQRKELATVVGYAGNSETMTYLEKLSHDSDNEVAQSAIQAMRSLNARL